VTPARHRLARELLIAAGLLLAVAATRLPSFCRSVLDWDESLYFVMAEQWRAGHLPYTAIWDNKPVGIYAIFALFQALFGDRIAAMRIAGIVFVAAGAFTVYGIGAKITQSRASGFGAGILFVIGSLSNDGLADNTELFMAAFTALAVLVALSSLTAAGALLAGLLMGAAFMVKYVAVFEDPAILLLILSRHRLRRAPVLTLSTLCGAGLPLAATAGLYAAAGQWPVWWDASIVANFRRAGKDISPSALAYIWHVELLRWGPLFLCGAVLLAAAVPVAWRAAVTRRLHRAQAEHLFLALWLLGGCAGVAAAKSFFDHYFLQLLPVLCVAAAWVAQRIAHSGRGQAMFLAAVAALPLLAAGTALTDSLRPVLTWHGGHPSWRPDTPAQVAAAIAPALAASPGAAVYVFDDQPIIYSLAHRAPPTRYAFPSVLTTGFLAQVAGVDASAELARILAARPLFIIRRVHPVVSQNASNQAVYAALNQALADHYQLWRTDSGTEIYRLTNTPPKT